VSTASIAIITRREVRDMINDWRIIVPIFLLTFILPLLLAGAAIQLVGFVEEGSTLEGVADRLIPFVVLLVGFVPASFSLITALESFVGERERNSLESLLAMPISDRELYVGKLISSLITPLLSSYTAMLVFSFILYSIAPDLYLGSVTFPRLVLLYITVGLMAVAMVSGAVVISSHISSIRAANLMSSFVLVPMAVIVQIAAVLIINDLWNIMWLTGLALLLLAVILVRTGLVTFNREEILSREHQRESEIKLFSFVSRIGIKQNANRSPRWNHPIALIAGRELRETITDWRVLVPVFVLTFIIPLILVGGTGFAVDFLENPKLVADIIPFVVLLVGFIPASFSLIVALESFVGERERNSLEALLAMPISDRDLYVSKLISSSLSPLVTSWSAMLIFSLSMSLVHPQLYYFQMTTPRLLQILLLIGIMTVAMVAGAVVISSHTGSIRAANLLASFVLIPMAVIIQVQAPLVIAERWDLIQIAIAFIAAISAVLIRTGIGAFNREEILSREHEEFNLQHIIQTFTTFFREYQPAGVTPDQYRGDSLSIRRFYRHELPALLKRDLRYPLIVALIAACIGLFAGTYLAATFEHNYNRSLARLVQNLGTAPPPSLGLALAIFVNNLRVSILSNVFSMFAFGIFAFLVPAVAFTQIGFVTTSLSLQGGSWTMLDATSPLQFLLGYVIPHGIIELPVFLISAALGIRIGASLLSPPPGFSVGQNVLWSLANFARVWLLLLLPLVLVASLIEGLISPAIIFSLYR
jgi:uncharacterized membrane protein SpoIIM required for sporulation/ABC-type Na+ efflux pump permease subunit